MSGSSWGFCLAIYDFVGLILGHFGPMFGPTTYSVSWRAICWPYLGHIGSFQGYVGPYLGSCAVNTVKKLPSERFSTCNGS